MHIGSDKVQEQEQKQVRAHVTMASDRVIDKHVDKQDKLLQLSLMVLRDLAEDYGVERKLVGHKICQLLVQLLQRQSEDMLIITLAFLLGNTCVSPISVSDKLTQQEICVTFIYAINKKRIPNRSPTK